MHVLTDTPTCGQFKITNVGGKSSSFPALVHLRRSEVLVHMFEFLFSFSFLVFEAKHHP